METFIFKNLMSLFQSDSSYFQKKLCKFYYNFLLNNCKNVKLPIRNKWGNMSINPNDEKYISQLFNLNKDNSIKWLQYRILFGILPTDISIEKLNCLRVICV